MTTAKQFCIFVTSKTKLEDIPMTNQEFQDQVQSEFYSHRPTPTVETPSTSEPVFTDSLKTMFGKPMKLGRGNKYMNMPVATEVGKKIKAYMIGCTVYPEVGSVITYQWGDRKIYDLMDVPGVSKAANDERKRRYLQLFGSRPNTVQKALDNQHSFSASIGTIWGHHVKCIGRKFEAVLDVYKSTEGYYYFGLASGSVV